MILGWRGCPVSQPGDFPRGLGGLATRNDSSTFRRSTSSSDIGCLADERNNK
ncbi:MAG: hypothetical protein V7K47_22145 [Nostoc sp.]